VAVIPIAPPDSSYKFGAEPRPARTSPGTRMARHELGRFAGAAATVLPGRCARALAALHLQAVTIPLRLGRQRAATCADNAFARNGFATGRPVHA